MAAGARIAFSTFASEDSPLLRQWIAHARRSVGDGLSVSPTIMPTGPAVVWQLVSGNNRQLARSARAYASLDDARADAERILGYDGVLEVSMVTENASGKYGWYASIDGVAVLTCARWYETERDRSRAVALATQARSERL